MHLFENSLIKILIVICGVKLIKGNDYYGDEDAKACDDFYEYACHNYEEENPDGNYSEITQKLDYEMNKKLFRSLNYLVRNYTYDKAKQSYTDKMLMYWQACKQEGLGSRNISKYLEVIKPNSKLNWPLMEAERKWRKTITTWDLWSLLGELQSLGLNNLIIKTEINRNEDNTLNIWLAPASITENASLNELNINKILLKLLAIDPEKHEEILQQFEAIKMKWQTILKRYGSSHQLKHVHFTQLKQLYPQLHLTRFLQKLLGSREIANIGHITLEDPQYFEFLNRKLWPRQELHNLCNYIMLKFLYYLVQDSTQEFTDWWCLKDLKNKFDLSLNYLYYQDYFNFEPQRFRLYFHNLLYQIRETILKYFHLNHLQLSQEQIVYLSQKLLSIKINIGNLPRNVNAQIIENYYQDLPALQRDNYYKNHLLLLKHRHGKSLLYPQNQTHFIVTSNDYGTTSSPFYVAHQNMIVIPFASFQKPAFKYLQTLLEQVSIFGFILAHELTHAFDIAGLHYDHEGYPLAVPSNILQHKNFTNAINCMQEEHPTPDIDERIADLFAVRVAYRTYVDYYAEGHTGWEKMFFMNMAQFFCGKNDLKFIDHDTDPVRLQQIVKNFLPFSWVFGCSEGSRMYKKNKCRLY